MRKNVVFAIFVMLLFSCARVGSPRGGEKDSTPPKVIKSYPDSLATNVSMDLKELRIYFDKYVMLKDPGNQLIITPPLKKIKKIIPSNLANKYVSIKWEDTLKANTTYNFNFGNSIIDYNEGNALPYYSLPFSTGPKIDSIYVSGIVVDALESMPENHEKEKDKPIVVGLYEANVEDFKQKPYYITKTDNDGYFELNYISPGKYILLAFENESRNSVYDEQNDKIAFLKDTLDIKESISEIKLRLSPPKKKAKYKEIKTVVGGIQILFEGNPDKVEVIRIDNDESPEEFGITHLPKSDSVNIWIDPKSLKDKTTAIPMKFSYKIAEKTDTVSVLYKINPQDEFLISNSFGHSLPPGIPFRIMANEYLKEIDTKKWSMKSDSAKVDFQAQISKTNPYQIIVNADFKEGKEYELSVPKHTVNSFYASNEKKFIFNFSADKSENYGKMTLNIKNPPESKFWVQLLNDQNEVAYQQFLDKASTSVNFKNLKPNPYIIRILVDNNGNGQWDYADFEKRTQAEDSYIYPKKITIRQSWEMVETWDLKTDSTAQSPKVTSENIQ